MIFSYYFASGDGPFYFAQSIRKLGWLPVVWRQDEGFGTNHTFRLWYDYLLQLVVKILSTLGFSWWWIDKLLWIGAAAVAAYASYSFGKQFLPKKFAYLASLIYTTNTYFLMIFGGGQLGVAWGYAIAPLVLESFVTNASILRRGLLLGLLGMIDLRIAYLAIGAIVLLAPIRRIAIPLVAAIGINAYWILPTVFGKGQLDPALTNPGMLKFLSVADFSHAISLLHPNWPENLFGKVYFLQPEFLVIPILAFAAVSKKTRYFALLALVGAFFAKGVNGPFGGIFSWLFTRVPGFVMFRDPTKFYIYVALAYSILIPYALSRIRFSKIAVLLFVLFWSITVRQMFLGKLTGNFRLTKIPDDYLRLEQVLVSDPTPSRTLWIPHQEKFAYQSATHPLFNADETPGLASVSGTFMAALAADGIKYVIVPADVEKRIFLTDYTFDSAKRDERIASLAATPLRRDPRFSDVAVFINESFRYSAGTPQNALRQQQLAVAGVGVSLLSLCLFSIYFLLRR